MILLSPLSGIPVVFKNWNWKFIRQFFFFFFKNDKIISMDIELFIIKIIITGNTIFNVQMLSGLYLQTMSRSRRGPYKYVRIRVAGASGLAGARRSIGRRLAGKCALSSVQGHLGAARFRQSHKRNEADRRTTTTHRTGRDSRITRHMWKRSPPSAVPSKTSFGNRSGKDSSLRW